MIYLSQRDPRWSTMKLGKSQLTVGRYGCTTTCISMLSDYFGSYVSPAEFAGNQNLYTKDGLIIWGALNVKRMALDGKDFRQYKFNPTAIDISLKDKDKAVALQVDNGVHWITAVRKIPLLNDYLCVDPWTGGLCMAKQRYKNITGSAHFKRK